MDEIRKTICIDDVRSRYSGIIPYIEYGTDSTSPKVVVVENNGNWGQFPMDFAKVKTVLCGDTITYQHTVIATSGITENDNSIEARLRYCDLTRKYNYIQKCLRNGIYCKVIKQRKIDIFAIDCDSYGCGTDNINSESSITTTLISKFDNDRIKYDFIPMKAEWFRQIGEFTYLLSDNLDNIDNDAITWINSVLNANESYVVLLSEYDIVKEYEDDWSEWWEKWFGPNWGSQFRNHIDYDSFQFCRDFEKYCLGIVCVPEKYNNQEITGVLVPDYVTYNEISERIQWFKKNDIPNKDKKQKLVWDNMGGEAFFNFLKDTASYWITSIPYRLDEWYLSYVKPYISIPICLEDEASSDVNYENYIVDGAYEPFSAVGIYSGYSQFENSNFVLFDDSGYVESKLENVILQKATQIGDIVGVWGEFSYTNNAIPIFLCVYKSGTSIQDGWRVTRTNYFNDGHFVVENIVDYADSEISPMTTTSPERIWVESMVQVDVPLVSESITPTSEELLLGISAITLSSSYTRYNYAWWECKMINPIDYHMPECGDGEIIGPNNASKYRTIPTLSCIGQLVESPSIDDLYYFSPDYDNGRANTTGIDCHIMDTDIISISIPYSSGTYYNMTQAGQDSNTIYIGDYIPDSGINITSGTCNIEYVVGGKATYDEQTDTFSEIPNTGIHYKDTYPIRRNTTAYIYIDGYVDVEVFYDLLDTESTKTMVYSDDYRMYRYANQSMLVGMEVGTMWTSGTAITAMLFTRDETEKLIFEPIEKPNIEMDRGNAAAFERYFKLSECNTLSDLTQYGNNFFNL